MSSCERVIEEAVSREAETKVAAGIEQQVTDEVAAEPEARTSDEAG